jgi:hypothetical protein
MSKVTKELKMGVWDRMMDIFGIQAIKHGYCKFNLVVKKRETTSYAICNSLEGLKEHMKRYYDEGFVYTEGRCFDHHWEMVYEKFVEEHNEYNAFVIYLEESNDGKETLQSLTNLTSENLRNLNINIMLFKKKEQYKLNEAERLKEEEEHQNLIMLVKCIEEKKEDEKLEEERRKLQMNKPSKQELTKQANKAKQNKKKEKEAFEKEVMEKAKIIEQIEREKALKKKLQKQKKEREKRQREEIPELIPIAAYNRLQEFELEEIENIVYIPVAVAYRV